jgi:NADH-quinone oxidoreductase subunit J
MRIEHWSLASIALLTLASAVAAMSLRNLVHCALMLALTFAGLAAIYLQLGAQFVGFAQILIYIGAVAILIVFAILLTRETEPARQSIFSGTWMVGFGVAVAVFALLSAMILSSRAVTREMRPPPEATVRQIGDQLMGRYVLPLEVVGLLLTAALIGAAIIALRERESR